MKRAVRLVLVCLMLAAVPLRGYAGALMLFCGSHEHPQTEVAEHAHDGDAEHNHSGGAAPACSVCASCCAGAGLVSEPMPSLASGSPKAGAIPFFAHQVSDFVPDHLDRPPSAL